MMFRRYKSKTVHVFTRILIHSSFCLLNFMSPVCRPNFAEVARPT